MQNAFPRIPSFHDGYLTGIELVEKSAAVGLQDYNGSKYRLHLLGIEALLANQFRQCNIIFSLEVTTGTALDIGDIRLLWPEPHPSATAEYREKDVIFVEGQRSRIALGEAVWINLVSSYSCDLIAVCESVELIALDADASIQISN